MKAWVSPFSSDPLNHFNASEHTGPPLPRLAVPAEVFVVGKHVQLEHAEHPVAVLNESTQPGNEEKQNTQEGPLY